MIDFYQYLPNVRIKFGVRAIVSLSAISFGFADEQVSVTDLADSSIASIYTAQALPQLPLAWPAWSGNREDFDQFRATLDTRLGTEEDPFAYFSLWDDKPLAARLLVFGQHSHHQFLGLDPSVVGLFAAPSWPDSIARAGLPVTLTIQASGREIVRRPNQAGVFPRVFLAPDTTVHLSLRYPSSYQGKTVYLGLPGGGTVSSEELVIDDSGQISFTFSVTQTEGTWPIEALVEGDRKTLNFWLGPLYGPLPELLPSQEAPEPVPEPVVIP